MTDHEKSHDQEILKQRLLELPEEMLVHVRHGFSSFAKSAAITRERVATTILERLSSRESIDIEELANENGIEKSTTADIATAISVIVGATNDLKIDVGDFTSHAKGNLFDDEYSSQILELETSVLNSKGEIADALQTSRVRTH